MGLDLKVYKSSKLDLDNKDIQFDFIDYFSVRATENGHYDTLYSIESNCDKKFDEREWDDNRTFDSYVYTQKRFEDNNIVTHSSLKDYILNHKKYKDSKFNYVVIQVF